MALLTAEGNADVEGGWRWSKPALGRLWKGWTREGNLNLGLHLSTPGSPPPPIEMCINLNKLSTALKN